MSQESKQLLTTILEAVIASLVFVILFILVTFATPDQLSAEADWHEEALRKLEAEGAE